MTSNYEKQMKWKLAAQQKASQSRPPEQDDSECTFTPMIFTSKGNEKKNFRTIKDKSQQASKLTNIEGQENSLPSQHFNAKPHSLLAPPALPSSQLNNPNQASYLNRQSLHQKLKSTSTTTSTSNTTQSRSTSPEMEEDQQFRPKETTKVSDQREGEEMNGEEQGLGEGEEVGSLSHIRSRLTRSSSSYSPSSFPPPPSSSSSSSPSSHSISQPPSPPTAPQSQSNPQNKNNKSSSSSSSSSSLTSSSSFFPRHHHHHQQQQQGRKKEREQRNVTTKGRRSGTTPSRLGVVGVGRGREDIGLEESEEEDDDHERRGGGEGEGEREEEGEEGGGYYYLHGRSLTEGEEEDGEEEDGENRDGERDGERDDDDDDDYGTVEVEGKVRRGHVKDQRREGGRSKGLEGGVGRGVGGRGGSMVYRDEPIVELLERERRAWQSERLKLLHCIHLQQLELGQRAVQAQERANDIAKEFSRVVESFEDRLVSLELSVQKEMLSIRSVAETLKVAAQSLGAKI